MSLEVIEIAEPIEQKIRVAYGQRQIIFDLRWNEDLKYWYVDIYEGKNLILGGSTFRENSNTLWDSLRLGKLYLIDLEAEINPNPPTKDDLGGRLTLMRDYALF